MNTILLVFIGGGLGSLTRLGISYLIGQNFKSSFPIATLCSNVLSCIILGIVVGMMNEKLVLNSGLRMFLLVGFCGGFSTFSTFSYETVELIRSGSTGFAIANILISVSVCISLVYFMVRNV